MTNDSIARALALKALKNASTGGGGTGTSNYDELENIPTINGIKLIGNKTAADLGIKEDKNHVYEQPFETTEWNITHNMGKYPSVMVVDNDLNQVWAEVQYIDLNTVKIRFTYDFTGKAFLN